MRIFDNTGSLAGPAELFTGDVWYDKVVDEAASPRMRVNVVRFAPRARSAWHAHAVGQTLYVLEGVGLVQARGEAHVEIRPGDVVHTPPGEWHWHGAAPTRFMAHLAMWEVPEEGPEIEWGDLVTDAEYGTTE